MLFWWNFGWMHSESYQYLDTVVFERLLLYIAIYLAIINDSVIKIHFFQYIIKHLFQLWKHKFYLFDEHSFFSQ